MSIRKPGCFIADIVTQCYRMILRTLSVDGRWLSHSDDHVRTVKFERFSRFYVSRIPQFTMKQTLFALERNYIYYNINGPPLNVTPTRQ
jgi:hypothetical protein